MMSEKLTCKCHKGAMFIEYALILAFVIVAGLIFVTSGGLKDSVASIFGDTGKIMAQAVGESSNNKKNVEKYGFLQYFQLNELIMTNLDKFKNKMTNGVLRSTDTDALAALAKEGIKFPDGEGEWVLVDNGKGGYQLTQLYKEASDGNTASVIFYNSTGGWYGKGVYSIGGANLNTNGNLAINSANDSVQSGSVQYSVGDYQTISQAYENAKSTVTNGTFIHYYSNGSTNNENVYYNNAYTSDGGYNVENDESVQTKLKNLPSSK